MQPENHSQPIRKTEQNQSFMWFSPVDIGRSLNQKVKIVDREVNRGAPAEVAKL